MVCMVYSYLNRESQSNCTDKKNQLGNTCLHLACEWGSLDIVNFLIEKKFTVNVKNLKGESPLHLSIMNERWDIFQYLLGCSDIDINAATDDGETPLHCATYGAKMHNYVEKIISLPSFNSLNSCDIYGDTPVFNACRTGDMNMLALFIKK